MRCVPFTFFLKLTNVSINFIFLILEINGLICLESDNESEHTGAFGDRKHNENAFTAKLMDKSESDSRFVQCSSSFCASTYLILDFIMSSDVNLLMKVEHIILSCTEMIFRLFHKITEETFNGQCG